MRRVLLVVALIISVFCMVAVPVSPLSLADSSGVGVEIVSGSKAFNWGDKPTFRLKVCGRKGEYIQIAPWLEQSGEGDLGGPDYIFEKSGCVSGTFSVRDDFYTDSQALFVFPLNGDIMPDIASELYSVGFYLPMVFVRSGEFARVPVDGSYVVIRGVPPELFSNFEGMPSQYILRFKRNGNNLSVVDEEFPIVYSVWNSSWMPQSIIVGCGRFKILQGGDAVRPRENGVIEIAPSDSAVEIALGDCYRQDLLLSWAKRFALNVIWESGITGGTEISTDLNDDLFYGFVAFWYGPYYLSSRVPVVSVRGVTIRILSNGEGGVGKDEGENSSSSEQDMCLGVSSPVIDDYVNHNVPFVAAPVGRKCIIAYDGSELRHIPTDAPVVIKDGRTLVPMRFFLEAIGSLIWWVPAQKKVIAVVPFSDFGIVDFWEHAVKIEMWIGNPRARVGGVVKQMPSHVPPQIIAGRTYVPLRFVGEVSGWAVQWDKENKMAIIHR